MMSQTYLFAFTLILFSLLKSITGTAIPTAPSGFRAIFTQNFTSPILDLSVWNHYQGSGQNGEEETYPDTDEKFVFPPLYSFLSRFLYPTLITNPIAHLNAFSFSKLKLLFPERKENLLT